MKAWCVHDGWPEEGCLLVFAPTRNRARQLFISDHPLIGDFQYRDTVATRASKWDDLFDDERVVCDNSELPKGTPDLFWCDEEEA